MVSSFSNFSAFFVFLEGILSFFSPCILPLIPIYLTYLAGSSMEELSKGKAKKILYLNSVGFIVGFSIIFILLGATATAIGQLLNNYTSRIWFERIGGMIIIFLGLYHAKVLKFPFFEKERRFQFVHRKPTFWQSILMGMAFSFGWTPCVGPALGAIMVFAATEETVIRGILLLILYSLGLAIPFIITSFFAGWVLKYLKRIYKHFSLISKIAGWILVLLGIAVLTGQLNYFIRI